jgi:hypothetical protein
VWRAPEVDVRVQTSDITPRDLSPNLRWNAYNDLLLRRVMQKMEWKEELDEVLMDIRFRFVEERTG